MSLLSHLMPNGRSGFGYGSTAEDATEGLDLSKKTFVVTGCNSGLGLETVRVLAMRGARVIGTARTKDKAASALASVGARSDGNAFECELSAPGSVRGGIEAIKASLGGSKIDAVIANAGIMALPKLEKAFGIELQFFTNHVGHFILVNGLVDALANDGRVVMVSSRAHLRAPKGGIEFDNLSGEGGYDPWRAYGQSKMANLLFAKELARRLEGTSKTANSIHPGVIKTNLGRHMDIATTAALTFLSLLVFKNIAQGAATQCYVAANPKASGISGKYWFDCNVQEPRADGTDAGTAKRLWTATEEIVARL